MRKKFHDLLHAYKVASFKTTHDHEHVEETTKEIQAYAEEALNNAYEYHFHKDTEPARIETFNLIRHYTVEAILPPVLEKTMRRIVMLEKQHEGIVKLIDDLLEALSEDEEVKGADRSAV